MYSVFLLMLFVSVKLTASQVLERQQIESYNKCSTDSDCKENAFCFGNDDTKRGKCKCLDGFELFRNRTFYECSRPTKLDDACTSDFQCRTSAGSLAFCDKYQICKCSENSHAYEGRCYLPSLLGEICQTNGNCLLKNGSFAFCTFFKCSCHFHEEPSEDKTECLPSRPLGAECSTDNDCLSNAQCSGNICRCKTRFVISRDDKICLPVAESLSDPCEEDAQCTKFLTGTTCQDFLCVCLPNYHEFGKKCIKTSKVGQSCMDKSNCIFDSKLENIMSCNSGRCECLYGNSNDEYGCKLEKEASSSTAFAISIFCLLLLSFNIVFVY